NGRRGGPIDVVPLVVDILWLLPGLIPGLVCLVVDFATGCIYTGGRVGASLPVLPPNDPRVSSVEVHLDGWPVASGSVAADGTTRLQWSRKVDEATLRARASLSARRSDGALAEARLQTLI